MCEVRTVQRNAAQMRVEHARQLLDAGADRPGSNQALQLEIMIRETTRVGDHARGTCVEIGATAQPAC